MLWASKSLLRTSEACLGIGRTVAQAWPLVLVSYRFTRAKCGASYKRWRPGRASTRGSCCGESPSIWAPPEDWGIDFRPRQVGEFCPGPGTGQAWLPRAAHSIALAFPQQALHSLVCLLCLEPLLCAEQDLWEAALTCMSVRPLAYLAPMSTFPSPL